jgi:addiction module HigA family antidote
MRRPVRPVPPGDILLDVLEDTKMSLAEFAEFSGLTISRVEELVRNKKPINQDTALAIGKGLGTNSQIWLNLQTKVDNWDATQ